MIDEIRVWLEGPRRNGWFGDERLQVYLRKGYHIFEGTIRRTLDLANVSATEQGRGSFRAFIPQLEAIRGDRPIYVENVLKDRFARFWIERGYVRDPKQCMHCFWGPEGF